MKYPDFESPYCGACDCNTFRKRYRLRSTQGNNHTPTLPIVFLSKEISAIKIKHMNGDTPRKCTGQIVYSPGINVTKNPKQKFTPRLEVV